MADKRLPEHEHPLPEHEHGYVHHGHPLPEHEHDHRHADWKHPLLLLLRVFEVGSVNSEQLKAINAVRAALGELHGNQCAHEHHAFEGEPESERLICQDCRQELDPKKYIA